MRAVTKPRNDKDRIWNTSTQEERERIKEFWLSLGEEERKSLVKIEKEAVLRKMKEQQKHSCSCTVCGRKRTAIEEELEVLYDAYYEELEQYASLRQLSQGTVIGKNAYDSAFRKLPNLKPQRAISQPLSRIDPNHILPPANAGSRLRELADDEDPELEEDELDEEDYSDEYEDEEDYSDDDPYPPQPGPATELFNFGQHLTVKGTSSTSSFLFR